MKKVIKSLITLIMISVVIIAIVMIPPQQKQKEERKFDAHNFVHKDINFQFGKYEIPNAKYGDFDDILRRGEILVLTTKDSNNPLFQMKTNEGIIGENIEFAYGLAKILGVKLTYKMSYDSYEDVVEAIFKNEGDIGVAKFSYTPERVRKVMFTLPYVASRKALMINRVVIEKNENKSIYDLLNSDDVTIMAAKGTSYVGFITDLFPKSTVVQSGQWDQDIEKKIGSGEYTASMRDEIRVRLMVNKNPNLLLKILPLVLKEEKDDISAIVPRNSMALLESVNRYIEANFDGTTSKGLIEKYKEYIK